MTVTEFRTLAKQVSNWGRWGEDDQRGTLNLITPDVLKRAGASIRQGKLFSLAIDFNRKGPQHGEGRFNPHVYMTAVSRTWGHGEVTACMSDDVVHMPSQCATQWDSLAHFGYEGKYYNNVPNTVVTPQGASRLGIEQVARAGVASRGVLLDIARLRGVERLAVEDRVMPEDLDAAEARQGVRVEAGDVLLVRTGHITVFTRDGSREAMTGPQPGLHMRCAQWFRDRDVAAVAADNLAVEPLPPQPELPLPLHMLCLRDMGLIFGEFFDLEALAADCAADGQYEFFFTAPALPVTGAVGAAINPLAIK
ncbi:MAG: cyclase family protein [Pseudomonadales bacterium]